MNLPIKLSKPAQRALSNAGITTLNKLASYSEEDIAALHGIGQNALIAIRESLSANGLAFAKKKK